MLRFFKRRADVLNHWISFVDGFQISPSHFYMKVKQELSERDIPKMEMSEIEFSEGGLLSEKRVYLRMLRERIVFDICAAPFGKGFFFSCRTSEIPLVLKLWHIIALFFVLPWCISVVFLLYIKLFGVLNAPIYGLFSIVIAIYALRNLVAMGLQDLDKWLVRTPLIGVVYEVIFRRETYHRIDSRLCYLHVVPTVVKQLAEEYAAAKGVKLINQYELSPILGELYRRSGLSESTDLPLPEPAPRLSI
jgi:hypothetical protein